MSEIDISGWSYGTEHEWADWPLSTKLPPGYKRDLKDITIVNTNGIANDPTGKFYEFGGEINTPPTSTIEGQIECLRELKQLLPIAKVNYRSNLHVHIRIPGLKNDLIKLKQIQRYIHDNMRDAFYLFHDFKKPKASDYKNIETFEGAKRRYRRRKVSHQTLLTQSRLSLQLKATSCEEFFNREPPQSFENKPLWHCQPRLCVNLRQMLETDTIEFRHFAGTLDEDKLRNCFAWAKTFLVWALKEKDFKDLLKMFKPEDFPSFPEYEHETERKYRATCHDGTINKNQIAFNIKAILSGEFR